MKAGRIVGGQEAVPNNFPWMVPIVINGELLCKIIMNLMFTKLKICGILNWTFRLYNTFDLTSTKTLLRNVIVCSFINFRDFHKPDEKL
jgi:hypothetical protein